MGQDFYNYFQFKDQNNTRLNASATFLQTGIILAGLGGTKCYSSGDCASGWACVNNNCTFLSAVKSENLCDTGPAGSGGCGGDSGCGTSTPGTGCLAVDCCGTRCCRYEAAGNQLNVNCYCGECQEEEKECSSFCDSYYKNNGRQAEGCSGSTSCSECSYCGSEGKCVISYGGPCWCQQTRNCELCQDNGSWTSDPACWPCRNFTECGVPTGERYCSPGANALLQSVNGRPIDAPCDPGCSNSNCETRTVEIPGGPPPNGLNTPLAGIYNCCPTCECSLDGYITAEGSGMTTYLIEECDAAALPEECCFVECNCHSECESGKCNNNGTCFSG